MTTARDILTPHLDAALTEATERKMSSDAVARVLFEQALRIWKENRPPEDIRAELIEAADHLDPDEDFMFMRPGRFRTPPLGCSCAVSGFARKPTAPR